MEDFTKKVKEERKQLKPHLKQAKQEGYKALIKYDKLIIEGKPYGAEYFKKRGEKRQGRTKTEASPENRELSYHEIKRVTATKGHERSKSPNVDIITELDEEKDRIKLRRIAKQNEERHDQNRNVGKLEIRIRNLVKTMKKYKIDIVAGRK
jgi:hypothetical protein